MKKRWLKRHQVALAKIIEDIDCQKMTWREDDDYVCYMDYSAHLLDELSEQLWSDRSFAKLRAKAINA